MTLAGWSQSKINPAGRILIDDYLQSRLNTGFEGGQKPLELKEAPREEAIVMLKENSSENVLNKDYIEIFSRIGNIYVIGLPIDKIEDLSRNSEVVSIEFGRKAKPMMDYARPSGKVSNVQDGFVYDNVNMSFDGTGVLLGMMDTGLEANHVNFKKEDGSSRIHRLWHFTAADGSCTEYNPSNISSFTTDSESGSHATHVAGILGGGYKGNGKYNYVSSPTGGGAQMREDAPIPYYGVATNADLAFSVGSLSYANILRGVENIISYGESINKTAVVNMSLGSTDGPHDGTDAYSQALSRLGKRGIIVMSSGNDGDANISIIKTFSSTVSGKQLKTFIANSEGDGTVDIWGSDNRPVTVSWGYYNKAKQTITPFMELSAPGEVKSGSTDFSTYFNGSMTMIASVSAANNRYQVYTSLANVSRKGSHDMYLVLTVTGTAGQTVYVYGDSDTQFSKRYSNEGGLLSGFTDGSPSNSINDACCASNIISVGSYTTRIAWGRLDGYVYGYFDQSGNPTATLNDISSFSSYGKSFQGTQLPYVCAPGMGIVSSYNSYNVNSKNLSGTMVAETTSNGKTYYWGNMQGTSMSCPFVTGTIGLWLQACPELDFDKVMDVIDNTSVAQTQEPQRWGAGKINALEGIKYILQKYAANGAVWEDDDQRLVVSFNGSGYDVTMAGEAQFTVTVYDIQGRPVATARGLDGQASVTTSELTPGVYVLAAQGASSRLTRKVTVR